MRSLVNPYDEEPSGAHLFLAGAAFGIAATLLAVILTVMPEQRVQQTHPHAFAILIAVLPVWVVAGLFLNGLAKSAHIVGRVNWILLWVYLALLIPTAAALALSFAAFSPEWGWALAIGMTCSVLLTGAILREFTKL
jgi:Na+(H+)/acetate symporter ActP